MDTDYLAPLLLELDALEKKCEEWKLELKYEDIPAGLSIIDMKYASQALRTTIERHQRAQTPRAVALDRRRNGHECAV